MSDSIKLYYLIPLILTFLLYGSISLHLWRKRTYYPIKEHSPFLVLFSIFLNLISYSVFPVFQISLLFDLEKTTLLFRLLEILSLNGLLTNYLLRGVRFYYIIRRQKTDKPSRLTNEIVLLIINIIVCGLLGVAGYMSESTIVCYFVIISVFCFEAGVIIVSGLISILRYRNILWIELVVSVGLIFLFDSIVKPLIIYNKIGLFSHFFKMFRDWLLLAVNVGYPLWISHNRKTLNPPSYCLDQLRLFLIDPLCVKTFYFYLKVKKEEVRKRREEEKIRKEEERESEEELKKKQGQVINNGTGLKEKKERGEGKLGVEDTPSSEKALQMEDDLEEDEGGRRDGTRKEDDKEEWVRRDEKSFANADGLREERENTKLDDGEEGRERNEEKLRGRGDTILEYFNYYLDSEDGRMSPDELYKAYFERVCWFPEIGRKNQPKNMKLEDAKDLVLRRLEDEFSNFMKTVSFETIRRFYEEKEEINRRIYMFEINYTL